MDEFTTLDLALELAKRLGTPEMKVIAFDVLLDSPELTALLEMPEEGN